MIQLRAIPHLLHFRKPAATSRGALVERHLWVIEAFDSEVIAVVGRGEAAIVPGLSIDDTLDYADRIAAFVIEFNGTAAGAVAGSMAGAQAEVNPTAYVRDLLDNYAALLQPMPSLRFGVECALLDLLQGGSGILFPSTFTGGQVGLATHGLIWMDTPEGVLHQIEAKIDAGFGVIKMKVGALPWERELDLLCDVRRRFPDITLRLDANCAFAWDEVHARLDDIARLNVEYLEEPIRCNDWPRYARLCHESPVPLALDETLLQGVATGQVAEIVEAIRPAAIVLKPALLGGLAEVSRLRDICDELGVAWWLNSLLESSIGHSAICQYVAATKDLRTHGLGSGTLFSDNFPAPIVLRDAQLWWQGYVS